jgi:FG-GAP-like repeat
VGNGPQSIAVADFNGDGKPDLAVANLVDNTVSILLNHGNGNFLNSATYATGPGPASVIAVDMNGDRKPDLVVADSAAPVKGYGPGLISVLLNRGDGTFSSKTDYATGPYPAFVVAGDFNGDGRADVAAATNLDIYGRVSVLLGNGDGSLQSEVEYEGGFGIAALTPADFNGDGKLDLAVVSSLNDTVFILAGLGNGKIYTQGTYGAGSGPVAVAAGNFAIKPSATSGADLAVTNFGSGSISVFVNPWRGRE